MLGGFWLQNVFMVSTGSTAALLQAPFVGIFS